MLVIYALRIRFDNKANSKRNGKKGYLKNVVFFYFEGTILKVLNSSMFQMHMEVHFYTLA